MTFTKLWLEAIYLGWEIEDFRYKPPSVFMRIYNYFYKKEPEVTRILSKSNILIEIYGLTSEELKYRYKDLNGYVGDWIMFNPEILNIPTIEEIKREIKINKLINNLI